jgi:hypothetical protein
MKTAKIAWIEGQIEAHLRCKKRQLYAWRMNMIKNLLSAVAITAAFTTAAFAATVTNDRRTPAADAATFATLALTSTTLSPGASWTDAPAIVTGNLVNEYRSPFEGTAQFATTAYFNVTKVESPAVMILSSVRSTLSFLWGSVDGFNTVKLINTDTGAFELVTLANLIAPETPQTGRGASFVTITGFLFNQVEFQSTRNSFELSNIAAVPLPAGGLLLLGAIGGIAALRRRKAA